MEKFITNDKGRIVWADSLIFTAKDGSTFYVIKGERNACKAFKPKSKKAFFYSYFGGIEQLKLNVQLMINECNEKLEIDDKRKAEEKERIKKFRATLMIGDILYTSWGYEQNNIDFYQVVSKLGAFCEIRKIGKHTHNINSMQHEVIPKPNEFISGKIKRKIQDDCIKISTYVYASLLKFDVLETGTKVYERKYTSSYA